MAHVDYFPHQNANTFPSVLIINFLCEQNLNLVLWILRKIHRKLTRSFSMRTKDPILIFVSLFFFKSTTANSFYQTQNINVLLETFNKSLSQCCIFLLLLISPKKTPPLYIYKSLYIAFIYIHVCIKFCIKIVYLVKSQVGVCLTH